MREAPAHGTALNDVADRWIRSRLGATIRAVEQAFDEYRFDFAASALYEFTWYEFCDWYLEIVKPVLQNPDDAAAQQAARRTLLEVLEALLRALHPLMPFITEDIWLRVAPLAGVGGDTIMLAPWPQSAQFPHDPDAETELRWVMQVVLGIRQIRGEMDISPARRLPLLLQHAAPTICSSRSAIMRYSRAWPGSRACGRWRAARPRRPPPRRWSAS